MKSLETLLIFGSIFHTTLPTLVQSSSSWCPKINDNMPHTVRYLLYNVNSREGFNLRRDVYMRIARLVKLLLKHEGWILVLPSWSNLYHWTSHDIDQENLPWDLFFDVESLKKYIPVMELSEYLQVIATNSDSAGQMTTIHLQNFENQWSDGRWEEKSEFVNCSEDLKFLPMEAFFTSSNVRSQNICLQFQGSITLMEAILASDIKGSVLLNNAEMLLHHSYGDAEYWRIRRSMRFSKSLTELAEQFLISNLELNYSEHVGQRRPADWREEEPASVHPTGAPFLCVHLRRGDFLFSRKAHVPSLHYAVKQIVPEMQKLHLKRVFVATDATSSDMKELDSLLAPYEVKFYLPDADIRNEFKDGGTAIIEQIICSYSRQFIGSYESTFSFRIQEERELLGFDSETTFNRLCGDEEPVPCEQPSVWKIVF